MNYLSQYYKNLSEQLQEKIKNLEYLLEYAPVVPPTESTPTPSEPKKETVKNKNLWVADTTFRQTYTKRYGDQLGKIISDVEQKRASMPQDLLQQVNQTYNIPSYKPEDIDRKLQIITGPLVYKGSVGESRPGGKKIYLSNTDPNTQTRVDDVKLDRKPTLKIGFGLLGDVVGHEATHSMQDPDRTKDTDYPLNSNKRQTDNEANFDKYSLNYQEWPAFASGLKYAYHQKTGKYIGANATDKDIDDLTNWWENQKATNLEQGNYYPAENNIIKSLNDSDPKKKQINREALKLIVKDNDKNTDTRMS